MALDTLAQGDDVQGFRRSLLDKYKGGVYSSVMFICCSEQVILELGEKHGETHLIPRKDMKVLARSPICFTWAVAAHPKTNYYNGNTFSACVNFPNIISLGTTLVGIDTHITVDEEVFILHTWYCDLWDVKSNDKASWGHDSASTLIIRLRNFVMQDRASVADEKEAVRKN